MATILTVDDSPSIRQMIKVVVLEPAGHNVVEAGDGAQGLAKAQAGKLDLVITDLNMPVMNGLELIRALRKLPSAVGMPIVFLTTESNDTVKKKSAGATGLMSTLGEGSAALPAVAARLETAGAGAQKPRPQDEAMLDELFARYTMERERDVHRQFLQTRGLASIATTRRVEAVETADDGIELF